MVTTEILMGAGPLVGLIAGFSDLFGGKSGAFEGNLGQAKDACLEKLEGKAALLAADPVKGLDIN